MADGTQVAVAATPFLYIVFQWAFLIGVCALVCAINWKAGCDLYAWGKCSIKKGWDDRKAKKAATIDAILAASAKNGGKK